MSSVLIIDDHALVAESLGLALRAEGLTVQRCTDFTTDAVGGAVEQVKPDLVLLDLDLGDGQRGEGLVPALLRARALVLVLTGTGDAGAIAAALAAGAAGWMSKSQPFAELVATVLAALRGEPVVDPRQRAALIDQWRDQQAQLRDIRERLARLSPREREVLAHLAAGLQADAIAATLFVSMATVRSQIRAILTKLGVTSQLTAVAMAHRAGWPAATDGAA